MLLAPFVVADAPVELPAEAQAVVRQLRELRAPEPPTEAEVTDALVREEDTCLELTLEMLASRRVPAAEEGGEPQLLSIQQERLLLSALGRMDRRRARSAVDRVLLPLTDEASRGATCKVLGSVGSADDLDLIVRLATPENPDASLSRALFESVRQGVAGLLHDAGAAFELRRAWRELPEPLEQPVLHAIGDAQDARCLGLLTEVITWDDDWALLAIGQVRLVGRSLDQEQNDALSSALAARVGDEQQNLAEAACFALGQLGDDTQLGTLLAALEDDREVVRNAARDGLVTLTGQQLPSNARVWEIWYDRELPAAEALLGELGSALEGDSEGDLRHAIRRATTARVMVHDLSVRLLDALDHSADGVRADACAALGALDSPVSAPALTDLLNDPSEAVRLAARSALESIARCDERLTASEWRARIEDHGDVY